MLILEQFNPKTNHWNKLFEIDEEDFDPDLPIEINYYNGPYRSRVGSIITFLGMPRKLNG